MKRKITIVTMLAFLMLLGVGLTGQASALTLPAPAGNALPYGDFWSYSLPVLQYFSEDKKEYSVKSTPGAIKDGIVIYTGSSGDGVVTNFLDMDDAYPSPSGRKYTSFSTGDVDDPGGDDEFSGDISGTWDTTLSALDEYLEGSPLYFFFNHNEDNGAANQDLYAWGRASIVDTNPDPNSMTTLHFDFNSETTPSSPGSYLSNGSPPVEGDYVLAPGEFIIGTETINHNLGANEAAYAIFSPEINAGLSGWMTAGYDVMQIDFRLAALSNGSEQLFILKLEDTTPIPEPATMLLLGSGLIGLGAFGRRKFFKNL